MDGVLSVHDVLVIPAAVCAQVKPYGIAYLKGCQVPGASALILPTAQEGISWSQGRLIVPRRLLISFMIGLVLMQCVQGFCVG